MTTGGLITSGETTVRTYRKQSTEIADKDTRVALMVGHRRMQKALS
jgi:hypothetical protein